ncbi:unnamed protein product [Adineta steineri]|uniref:Uncharacterized protein n=1 Tax=Adineta steineri TaxID=433720 RepID=A0A818HM03_9BILA|nr:unnamed protein product [Adineta steineri]CAF3508367.1 unnamed protein product [Adineta steineri]
MNMHEIKGPTEDLQEQLNIATEEIQSLRQQLTYLLDLTKNAWYGDETAINHLTELIGIDAEIEQNAFSKKKTVAPSSAKKKVTIAINDEILSTEARSTTNSTNHEHKQTNVQATARNTYLQPFLKQNHIDPIREQNYKKIFSNILRYRQNEIRNQPSIPNRIPSATVRPRATKHLYQSASPDHVVRHLGSSLGRTRPYFVFAGKEFFQQTTSTMPLHEKNGSHQSEQSDTSDDLEAVASSRAEPVIARPQTAKSLPQSSILRSRNADYPGRISSATSNGSNTTVTPFSERDRRDAMRLQRQLNLPRQGWLNQHF